MSAHADAGYFSRTRPEMLPFVPPHARRILELRCASGAFGAQLKQRQDAELDRTHLRFFFTRKSLERTLGECGYRATRIVGINPTPSLKARLASALSLGRLADSRYLQYAFVASPAHGLLPRADRSFRPLP